MKPSPFMLQSWPNAIVHIDGDAFFASCEQSVHSELKGRPVITGAERNIVASMSYEAKARGIKRATPIWEAKKICPEVVILPSDYETYSLISKRMFSILRRFTPTVEESSIDEGFADIKGLRRLYRKGYEDIARDIQRTIERELDLTVSVGLSLTKTLAKLAAKFEKPRGFTSIKGRYVHEFLTKVPVGDVCGIGPNTTALLNKRGVFTALDYAMRPVSWAKQLLGKIGVELWHELRGEMAYGLNTEKKESYQAISKTKTFTPPSKSYDYVKAQLFRNTESAFIKLRRYKQRAQRFIIYLRTQEFASRGMQADLNRPTIAPQEAFRLIEELLRAVYVPEVLYRATGIVLTRLEDDNEVQFDLFEDPVRVVAMRRLSHGIDEINKAYGKHTVFAGSGLFLKRQQRGTILDRNTSGTVPELSPDLGGRHAVPERKQKLLPGETARQHLNVPLWQIKI
ncbi:MAG: DNA polymerase IV [Candidatus Omnitrophica bacterium]|nr:DNA polymerase IV [Candidatus Omnitrophota bacterium]